MTEDTNRNALENPLALEFRTSKSEDTLIEGALCYLMTTIILTIIGMVIFGKTHVYYEIFSGLALATPVWLGLFKVPIGSQRVIAILGKRNGEVITEGYGWRFPGLYTGRNIDSRDQEVDVGEKQYLSQDNVPVFGDITFTLGVNNASQQEQFDGDILAYAKNLAEAGLRNYILKHRAMSTEIFKPRDQLTPGDLTQNQEAVAKFKDDVNQNGRKQIVDHINAAIKMYGRICKTVSVENIRLPPDVEGAGGEALREMLESAGDDVDWDNTVALATKARRVVYNDATWESLDPTTKASFWESCVDQVLSKKKQATRISVAGGGPLAGAAAILKGNDK